MSRSGYVAKGPNIFNINKVKSDIEEVECELSNVTTEMRAENSDKRYQSLKNRETRLWNKLQKLKAKQQSILDGTYGRKKDVTLILLEEPIETIPVRTPMTMEELILISNKAKL